MAFILQNYKLRSINDRYILFLQRKQKFKTLFDRSQTYTNAS